MLKANQKEIFLVVAAVAIIAIICVIISVGAYSRLDFFVSEDFKKARDYMKAGMFREAQEVLIKETKENPTNTDAHFMLGEAYLMTDSEEEAEIAFSRVIRLNPKYKEKIAQKYFERGSELLEKKKVTESKTMFEEAIRKNPVLKEEIARLYFRQGEEKSRMAQDPSEALSFYELAVYFDEGQRDKIIDKLFEMGEIYLTKGQIPQVEIISETIYNLDFNKKFTERLGRFLLKMGNLLYKNEALEKAREVFSKALAVDENLKQNDEFYFLYFIKLRKDNVMLIEICEDFVNRFSMSNHLPDVLYLLAGRYASIGEVGNARKYFKKLVSDYPTSENAKEAKEWLSEHPEKRVSEGVKKNSIEEKRQTQKEIRPSSLPASIPTSGYSQSKNQMNKIATRAEEKIKDQDTVLWATRKKKSFRVPANSLWTSTQISLTKGQKVVITAGGRINYGKGSCGPQGYAAEVDNTKFPIRWANQGALIAKVGESGEVFEIGNSKTFQAPASGILWLGINDDFARDNTGFFNVLIEIEYVEH